jgi:hypothetical protein
MHPRYRLRTAALVLLAALAALPLAGRARADADDDKKADKGDQSVFKHLKYRLIGPFAGGRVSRTTQFSSRAGWEDKILRKAVMPARSAAASGYSSGPLFERHT